MGPGFLTSRAENSQAMQSEMGGMVGSRYSQDRMVQRGGREVVASSKAYAHTMENYCAYRW